MIHNQVSIPTYSSLGLIFRNNLTFVRFYFHMFTTILVIYQNIFQDIYEDFHHKHKYRHL